MKNWCFVLYIFARFDVLFFFQSLAYLVVTTFLKVESSLNQIRNGINSFRLLLHYICEKIVLGVLNTVQMWLVMGGWGMKRLLFIVPKNEK